VIPGISNYSNLGLYLP